MNKIRGNGVTTKNEMKQEKIIKMNKRIDTLIAELRSKDGVQRKRARKVLVNIGKPAVPFLIDLLTDPSDQMRWEACKALGSIVDIAAAVPLSGVLGDESTEIHWLAAKALIALKSAAIVPVLQALEKHFDSPNFRQGAHHVLNTLAKQNLLNKDTVAVIDTLDITEPNSVVAWAARNALNSMGKTGRSS
jgi:HEAT repeat protein